MLLIKLASDLRSPSLPHDRRHDQFHEPVPPMSETTAIGLLAAYAVVTVLLIAWRVRRYDVNGLAWMLYCAVAVEPALPVSQRWCGAGDRQSQQRGRPDAVVDEPPPWPRPAKRADDQLHDGPRVLPRDGNPLDLPVDAVDRLLGERAGARVVEAR